MKKLVIFVSLIILVTLSACQSDPSLAETLPLDEEQPTFVFIRNRACPPCDAMEPLVDDYAQAYGEDVTFLKYDASTDGEAIFDAGYFVGHPVFFIMLPDGTETWRKFGIIPSSEIDRGIMDALAQNTS